MRRKHSAVQMFIAAILGLALLAASCAGIAEQETAGADTFLQEVVDALGDPEYGRILEALQGGGSITRYSAQEDIDVLRKMLAEFGCDMSGSAGTFEALKKVTDAFGMKETYKVDAAVFSELLPLLLLAKDAEGEYAGLLQDHYEDEENSGKLLYLKGCAYCASGRYFKAMEAFTESGWGSWEKRAAACVQPWPSNGEIWHNSDVTAEEMSLTFKVNGSDSATGRYFEVIQEDGTRAAALFLKGNGSVYVYLPGGNYRIREAGGTAWYGPKDLFGRDGKYETMVFNEFEDDEYLTELTAGYGWVININPVEDTPDSADVGSVDDDWESWNEE